MKPEQIKTPPLDNDGGESVFIQLHSAKHGPSRTGNRSSLVDDGYNTFLGPSLVSVTRHRPEILQGSYMEVHTCVTFIEVFKNGSAAAADFLQTASSS